MDSLVAAAVFGRRRRRGSHGKPAFDPRILPGLAFWYHPAAADVVKDDATGKVSRLIDLSGSGNDATQFTAANQLTWSATGLAGAAGFQCGSTGSMAGPIVDITGGFTFAFVCAPANVSLEQGIFEIANSSANNRLSIFQTSAGALGARVFSAQTTFIGRRSASASLANGTRAVVTVTWDGGTVSTGINVYINGALASATSDNNGTFSAPSAPTIPFTVGTASGANNGTFTGYVGDALFYPSVLAAADRQALESALLGNRLLYVPPAPPPAFSGTVYVATDGTATGAGTQASPIDEATFLSKGVGPGTTVVVRGGTYTQEWVINFSGTAADPTTMQVAEGEHVKLSNGYDCEGSYVTLTGAVLNGWLEIYQTDTTRTTTTAGSNPPGLPIASKQCKIAGAYSFVIGAVVHDLANGLVSQTGGSGSGFIDCVAYSNGWDGPDRGHGHSYYLHNDTGNSAKALTRCVGFNSFDIGAQYFAQSGAVSQITTTGGAIFASGAASATYGEQRNIDATNADAIENLTFDALGIYRLGSGASQTAALGAPGSSDITFTNCVVKGAVGLNECDGHTFTDNTLTTAGDATSTGNGLLAFRKRSGGSFAENTVDRNTYIAVTGNNDPFYYFEDDNAGAGFINKAFAGWQTATGWDANSTYTEGSPTASVVKVAASDKETGRGLVSCYNPAGSASLSVDLSTVLGVGDVYSVWHVYDLFGTPVISSATYDGNPVSLTQTGYTAPTPTGYGTTPASTAPYFNVFLVRKVA